MIRWVGIGFVWGGCILWGLRAAEGVRCRVRLLEDVGQALELLERDVVLNQTALPELLERLCGRRTPQGRQLFAGCRRLLERSGSFERAWQTALESVELSREDRALLGGLSQVLGRYDTRGQAQALSLLRQEVADRAARGREEAAALGRVYRVLGVTAGGFLVLTLL